MQIMLISARSSKPGLSSGTHSVLLYGCFPGQLPHPISTPGCLVKCLVLISFNQELGPSNYIEGPIHPEGEQGSRLIGLTIEPNPFWFCPAFLFLLSPPALYLQSSLPR